MPKVVKTYGVLGTQSQHFPKLLPVSVLLSPALPIPPRLSGFHVSSRSHEILGSGCKLLYLVTRLWLQHMAAIFYLLHPGLDLFLPCFVCAINTWLCPPSFHFGLKCFSFVLLLPGPKPSQIWGGKGLLLCLWHILTSFKTLTGRNQLIPGL